VNEVEQSTASALHLHVRLRPILREIRRPPACGCGSGSTRPRAGARRELVGANAWDSSAPNVFRRATGSHVVPPRPDLRVVVDELERL